MGERVGKDQTVSNARPCPTDPREQERAPQHPVRTARDVFACPLAPRPHGTECLCREGQQGQGPEH
ncbi:hypothetical protein PAL_GLEAN10002678 [Pteropus alecto]|uniref:Uncharacterized protein n=1 Tax=Pteropus alecto TaxID=9402 RepID=L5KEL1_PTEAL|nr:hypothetical protein PAL_GLEAN10002678 [Pteropus alecto]